MSLLEDMGEHQEASELVAQWGDKTRQVLHKLNELIAETLDQPDLMGFAFVTETTAKLLNYYVDIARVRQGERGPGRGDTVQ